jgi:hypothetical protein
MFKGLRFSPAGWVAAIGTLTAMTATMVLASPGGAATPEKEYTARFPAKCVVAPGSLNEKATLEVETHATGPETATEGETFEFHNASSTITSPAELGTSLFKLGSRRVHGKVTTFAVLGTNLEPHELNIAKPAAFPEGLPYEAPVEENKSTTFKVPQEGTYSFGPFKVTGKAGEEAVLAVNPEAGFKEIGAGEYEGTGKGIVSTLEGVNEKGEHVIGPLPVVCTASGELGKTPIVGGSTSTTSSAQSSTTAASTTTSATSSSTTTTAPTTSTTTSSTTTTSTAKQVTYSNWVLKGSFIDKKDANQLTNLPAGCTFNGHATVPGALETNFKCPLFYATGHINALQTATLGMELVQTEPAHGTITEAGGGNLTFKSTVKDNILVKSVYFFPFFFPENCTTKEPVVYQLETTAPESALTTGVTFKGEVTIPPFKCPSGFLGPAYGETLSGYMSGPNNPYTFTVEP